MAKGTEYAMSLIVKRCNGDVLSDSWSLSAMEYNELKSKMGDPHVRQSFSARQAQVVQSITDAIGE
jgi:hypothetical protein